MDTVMTPTYPMGVNLSLLNSKGQSKIKLHNILFKADELEGGRLVKLCDYLFPRT